VNLTSHHTLAETVTPLGPVLMAATPTGLAGVWFVGQRHMPPLDTVAHRPPAQTTNPAAHELLSEATRQLQQFFAQQRHVFKLPLDLSHGTAFQQSVWRALLDTPAGQTTSYGELARRLDKPLASRAVGGAVGRNPLSIVVPCHRVLGTRGAMTGYAGGLDRKRALLQLEGIAER
jgi:methylated-DNA-[protein]-cysteine S-methyltransferase